MTDDAAHELDLLRRRALEALRRIVKGRTWEDWKTIAEYVATGREWAMRTSNSNQPNGIRYNQALGVWFKRNPHFQTDIDNSERNDLMRCWENLPAVEHFLDGEAPSRRRQLNHPTSIWRAYKRKLAELDKDDARRKAEAAYEEAIKGDNGSVALNVPIPAPKPLTPPDKGVELRPDEDARYNAVIIAKGFTHDAGKELAIALLRVYGMKVADIEKLLVKVPHVEIVKQAAT
jgi:hypothetical protein